MSFLLKLHFYILDSTVHKTFVLFQTLIGRRPVLVSHLVPYEASKNDPSLELELWSLCYECGEGNPSNFLTLKMLKNTRAY